MKFKFYKLFLLALFIGLFPVFMIGQQHAFEYAKAFGGTNIDDCRAVTTDNQGNVYTAGTFDGTVDFDPNSSSYYMTTPISTYHTVFVQKLDGNGDFVWAKQFGAARNEVIDIVSDSEGNIYITGNFNGIGDFNPGSGVNTLNSVSNNAVYNNIFLVKLNTDGQYQWAANFGSATDDAVNNMVIDSHDNLYLTGYFTGTSDFDPSGTSATILSASIKDGFVLKLDKNRNFKWARHLGTSLYSLGTAITNDDYGNLYLTGGYRDTMYLDINGSPQFVYSASSYNNMFILKIDTLDNFHWIREITNPTNTISTAITVDPIGNVYTTGTYSGVADLDPDTSSFTLSSLAGITNSFIQKLDSSGHFVWAKSIDGNYHNKITDIKISEQGYLYTTGHFSGSADFDPNSTALTFVTTLIDTDLFIQSLDLNGNFIWARRIGDTHPQYGKDLHLNPDGTVYLAGTFFGTVDLNPDVGIQIATSNNLDCFLLKLRTSNPNDLGVSKIELSCYPNLIFQIQNYGNNTVDSFEIGWSVDNVIQSPITVYNSIPSLDSILFVGTFPFDDGQIYQIDAWINSINNTIDVITFNDSASANLTLPFLIEIIDTVITDVYEFVMYGSIEITPSGNPTSFQYLWNTGDTTQNLTNISLPGFYYLTITDAAGCQDTFSFEVGYVSTNFVLNNKQIQLKLYPNPIQQHQLLTLEFDAIVNEDIQYQIIGIDGKSIRNGILQKGILRQQIDSPNTVGLYYLQLIYNQEVLKTVSFMVK